LLELIESELAPDAPIPSKRELAQRHGLSRMTVRQAVDQLVSQGRLYRVPGRGTFAARPKIQMRLVLSSFTEDMRRLGLQPGAGTLAVARIPAGEEVGGPLGLPPTAEVHMLERLRTADGVPMAIERTHLPAHLTPGLLEADLANQSLYARSWPNATRRCSTAASGRSGPAAPTVPKRARSACPSARLCCASSASPTRLTGRSSSLSPSTGATGTSSGPP
jgi:DNA-binding GntR family transcriptional regulator